MAIYGPAVSNKYSPVFGQQRPQPSTSIPMGGFMGQNQIGGQSAINIYRTPEPELTPKQLEAQQFEDRAGQYQQDLAQFNLGQREAELEKQRAGAEEIASGGSMLNGQAVTRAEMDRYLQGVKQSGAKAQADFNRENPFYASARASMPQAPRPDQFSNDADYQSAISEYHTGANKQAREQQFNQKLNESRTSALRNSINQFSDDPMSYLMGGGQDGSTYSPDALMDYLSRGSQLFNATGKKGNFMDFILGSSAAPSGAYQPAPSGVYQPGTSYASQGFTPETAKASMMGGSPQQSSAMPSQGGYLPGPQYSAANVMPLQGAYVPGTSYAMQGLKAPQSDNPPDFFTMPKRNSSSKKDEMRQFNLDTFQRAAPGIDFSSNY